jgi:Beta-galactosidase
VLAPSGDPVGTTTRLGFSFSPRQCDYLGVDRQAAYAAALGLGPAVVRLGAYWSDVEPRAGRPDFGVLDRLVEQAEARGVRLVLTVGMKAPRWPEYYLPGWLAPRPAGPGRRISDDPRVRAGALAFLELVVQRYRQLAGLEAWQVENEPLDPAGPRWWRIGADFLAEEVGAVRALDPRRPILLTTFALSHPLAMLPLGRRRIRARVSALCRLADLVGIDVYTAVAAPFARWGLRLNWDRSRWERPLGEYLRAAPAGKVWVTEAQAEPWEPGQVVHTRPGESRSVTPAGALRILRRLERLPFDTVLLWGVEHWYARRLHHGDDRWWTLLGGALAA